MIFNVKKLNIYVLLEAFSMGVFTAFDPFKG